MMIEKRTELIRAGFCVIPDVIAPDFLIEIQKFTADFLARQPRNPNHRYPHFHLSASKRSSSEDATPTDAIAHEIAERIIHYPALVTALEKLGMECETRPSSLTILSKPAGAKRLYWHQDQGEWWANPAHTHPWPVRLFVSFYLVDTSPQNGCFQAIPGTHHQRIDLHQHLIVNHRLQQEAIAAVGEDQHPAMQNHPTAVDVTVRAGDLVIADSRVLHATYANTTAQDRNSILLWQKVFPQQPTWWERYLLEKAQS